MTRNYLCHRAIFSTGERFAVLLHDSTFQPVVLPTRYVIDWRRETKQASTLLRDLRVIGWFYQWCDATGIDLEVRLREAKLLTVAEITGFCRWLRARRRSDVIGSISQGTVNLKLNVLAPSTFNSYLGVVEDFLMWTAYGYIPEGTPTGEGRDTTETARERIRRAFRSNHLGGREARRRLGLTPQEETELRRVIHPRAKENPFKAPVRLRNYAILELMLATGIRRGELLKIKLNQLPRGSKISLTIERSPDDPFDTRKNTPEVKTRSRGIPIPKWLAELLWLYADKHRKDGPHPYLFTSHRNGHPLDPGGLNWIFSLLVRRCFPGLKGGLHPHALRHTFNDRLMEQAKRLGWDQEQRERVQKFLNGWSECSVMPEVYTRRHTEAEAAAILEAYQARLYRDEV